MNDFRFAFRQLLKNPGFAAVAVFTLALGIGANTTIFTLLNAFLLKPVGGRNPERLVGVYSEETTRPGAYRNFSYPNFTDLRASDDVFEDIYAFTPGEVGVTEGDTTRRVFSLNVSANYFSVFGTPVALGRDFLLEEETSSSPVVIVSHNWWQRHGAPSDIVGRSLTVNGRPYTIIGVAARGFTGMVPMFPSDLYFPLRFGQGDAERMANRARHDYLLVGRLKPDLTLAEANSRLEVVSARLAQAFPAENIDQRLLVARLPRMGINSAPSDDRGMLNSLSALLLGMSCAVLLIACLNLANVLLARGAARRKEIAVRLALGATRGAILRQLLVEGWLLALLGGACGLLVAMWTAGGLVSSLNLISPSPLTLETRPDWRVLSATFGFCVLATMFFALGPAWKLARGDVNSDLKEHAGEDRRRSRLGLFAGRHLLVIGQVALSLALLVAAGLFTRGAIKAVNVDPGFSFDRGFYLELDAGLLGYPESRVRQLYGEILERVRGLTGVEGASLAAVVPLGDRSYGRGVQRAGSPQPPPQHAATPAEGQVFPANYNVISQDYFHTLGVPLWRGREFEGRESSVTNLPRVAIINVTLADKLWPGEDALGKYLQFAGQSDPSDDTRQADHSVEVVGIVNLSRAELNQRAPSPMIFVPYAQAQNEGSGMNLHVRALPTVDASALLRIVRDEVRRMDPALPVLAAKTLRTHVATSTMVWVIRAGAWLFTALGTVAVLLAVVGVYGVKAYTVALRTREIGIRMALGATRENVLGLILREGAKLTLVGVCLGLLFATFAAKAMSSFLFEVQPYDPLIFVGAPVLLLVPALLACWLPARRAARVDPMVALRRE
jgi:predicted permease